MIFPFHRSICKAACRLVLMTGLGLLAACSQKAETLKLSVTQFGTATQAALDGYDAAYRAQFKPFAQSNTDRRATFVANMDAFRGTVSPSNIAILIDPDRVETTQDAGAEWAETLAELRAQYQSFVAIFDDVEAGSALGASAVTQSGPILKKLRTQLAALRRNLTTDPPEFLTRRSALIARLNAIRSEMPNHTSNHTPTNIPDNTPANAPANAPANTQSSNDRGDGASIDARENAGTLRYQMWWQDWQDLTRAEQAMQTDTLRQFVRASMLGKRLQDQIDNYARLDAAALLRSADQAIALIGEVDTKSPQELMDAGRHLAETATD